jgi:hypothetical protein
MKYRETPKQPDDRCMVRRRGTGGSEVAAAD